ncbi:MAG: hypothetical protein KF764_00640 [Labilithrix sp.]|nr:hypothetical protein [Labilithrix sp.]MBX3219166.1 hypothetical protein [Labilithrix sp.]
MRAPKIRKIGSRESAVSLRAPPPPPDRLKAPVWQVWIEGGDPIGPVSADQLARGIQAGKVPTHASVRRESDTFWGDILDAADIVAALKAVSAESEPPPPPSLAPSLVIRQYMVWVPGSDPVGPVSADQVARGIRAGKVPPDASIQRVGDLFASDVLDEPDVIAALKQL